MEKKVRTNAMQKAFVIAYLEAAKMKTKKLSPCSNKDLVSHSDVTLIN